MVSREYLRAYGIRAYELGRLRTASRIALVLIPAATVCLFERQGREACACFATLLLGVAIWLRWRNREGFDCVTLGLQAGSLPLIAGLLLDRFQLRCGLAAGASFCTSFALFVGAAAGFCIEARSLQGRSRWWSWFGAASVATLAASLGWVRLGLVGLTSVVLGIVLGSLITAAASARA